MNSNVLSNTPETQQPNVADNNHPSAAQLPVARRNGLDWVPADPWPQPVEGAALLDDLAALLRKHVVLPPAAADALALWITHTYAFHLRDVATYVGVESPEKRCGKTTLLEALSLLVHRPVIGSNISPPALFRVIEQSQPTLLIDEADSFFHGNHELRGILNAGYNRHTAFVLRAEWAAGETEPSLARICCWCPKIIAAIGALPETIADRCILIRMHRKAPSEKCERLRDLDPTPFRRRCARWVLDLDAQISSLRPPLPSGLHDRAADIWEPLLVLADLAGGPWPERARQVALALTSAPDSSNIGALLMDIALSFSLAKTDRLFSRDLVADLASEASPPWLGLFGGRPVTELRLAQKLRPYGIRPATLRIKNKVSKGYLFEDFKEIFHRYISLAEMEAYVSLSSSRPGQPGASAAPH